MFSTTNFLFQMELIFRNIYKVFLSLSHMKKKGLSNLHIVLIVFGALIVVSILYFAFQDSFGTSPPTSRSSGTYGGSGVATPRCGDGSCNGQETCSTCRRDCGGCLGLDPTFCMDTDGGLDYLEFGKVSFFNETSQEPENFSDFCLNNILVEYFCDGNIGKFEIIQCDDEFGPDYLCEDGACVLNIIPFPDLVTLFIAVDTQNVSGNETNVTVSAIIKNIGDGTAGISHTRFNIPLLGQGGERIIFTESLDPDHSASPDAGYGDLPSGEYTVTVNADWFNEVDETTPNDVSGEYNNQLNQTFTVP
jgi:hypothetical protein